MCVEIDNLRIMLIMCYIMSFFFFNIYVSAPNDCAVNCRATGHMFYATLSPAVQDGIPCRPATNTSLPGVCIAGKCQVGDMSYTQHSVLQCKM